MIQSNELTTKSVYHNNWALLCFLIIFFQPSLLVDRVPFNYLFIVLQLIMWSVILISTLSRMFRWNMYLWIWTAFCIIQLVVIICNGNVDGADPTGAIEKVLSYLFLVHFLDIFFSSCGKKELILFWKYLFIMLLLELISIPLFRMGIIRIYWLGIRTRASDTIIPFLLISLLLKNKLKKELFYSGIILSLAIALGLKVATGVIGIAIIAVCWWLLKRSNIKWLLKLLQPSVIMFLPLALSIAILFFNFQTHFAALFEMVFSKNVTLTGRVGLWENGILSLMNYDKLHQLWGFGFYNIRLWCRWKYYLIITEGHNQLLQMLHDTGIVGTVMLYSTWYFQLCGLKKCKNIDIRNIVASVCFSYFVMCITEIYCYHPYFFIVFAIAARSGEIAQNIESHQLKWRKEYDS